MVSSHYWLRQRMANLASHDAATRTVVLVLLLLVYISVAQGVGDARASGLNGAAHALSRRSGADSAARFPSLGPRLGQGLLQNGDEGLLQNGDADDSTTNKRPLAVKKGRLDPFNDFHKYRGGFDIESKHYWGSLVVTGLPGYAIAVGWLVLGFLLLLSICCARCWCRRSHLTHPAATPPNVLYFWVAIMVAAVLTMAVIAGCVVLFVGSREFTDEAKKVEHAIQDAAANATGTLDDLAAAIDTAENIWEPYSSYITSLTNISFASLNTLEAELNYYSEDIRRIVRKNTRLANKGITALIVSAAWILTILTALLFGISFVLDNAVKDICDAMNEYRVDPHNTTLDSLIPCDDLLSASRDLTRLAEGIYISVLQVNEIVQNISLVSNGIVQIAPLCQPFGPPPTYEYNGTCPSNTTAIGDLPGKLEPLHKRHLISDSLYKELVAYSEGVDAILALYPAVDDLATCAIVVDTFDKLLNHNCRPTKAAAGLVWDAFIILTISMILLIVWWVLLTCRRWGREQGPSVFPLVRSHVKHKTEE